MRFKEKTVIVTGGTQGIGRGIAGRFADEGAAVVIVGRNENNGKRVEEEIFGAGGRAFYVKADVGVEADVDRMVALAVDEYGSIDVLVNNAACQICTGTPFFDLSLDQWNQVIGVNLTGVFLCSRAAAKHMIKRKQGTIINIASVYGFATSSGRAPYATSKGGVVQLTRSLAVDLAPYSIKVNSIAPGAIATPEKPDEGPHPMDDYILLGRSGTVDEIAAAALFLSSEDSSYINGATITVDGGLMSLLPGMPLGIT